MHVIQRQYWAVRDYLSSVLKESKFKEHGRITPELVAAGDFLSYKFPVWTWYVQQLSLIPGRRVQSLSPGSVPCLRRPTSLAYTDVDEDAERLLSFGDSTSGAVDE
ncbi:hypothetical protein M405DRAFT_889572 [Rhizopogon salebrosus TDB-379]|nr:hypothetical protein M405DRAFT_889572 [Rhizopogon salebrosus TDB-379]